MMHNYTWSLAKPTLLLLLTEYLLWTNNRGAGMWGKEKKLKVFHGMLQSSTVWLLSCPGPLLSQGIPPCASDLLLEHAQITAARVPKNLCSRTPNLKIIKEKFHRNVSVSYKKLKGRWQTMKKTFGTYDSKELIFLFNSLQISKRKVNILMYLKMKLNSHSKEKKQKGKQRKICLTLLLFRNNI